MELVNSEKVILKETNVYPFIYRQYPDFRFNCPHCGSLDVLVSLSSSIVPLNGKCLDCKKNW
jgi:transcription elongation factor Elf1